MILKQQSELWPQRSGGTLFLSRLLHKQVLDFHTKKEIYWSLSFIRQIYRPGSPILLIKLTLPETCTALGPDLGSLKTRLLQLILPLSFCFHCSVFPLVSFLLSAPYLLKYESIKTPPHFKNKIKLTLIWELTLQLNFWSLPICSARHCGQ